MARLTFAVVDNYCLSLSDAPSPPMHSTNSELVFRDTGERIWQKLKSYREEPGCIPDGKTGLDLNHKTAHKTWLIFKLGVRILNGKTVVLCL